MHFFHFTVLLFYYVGESGVRRPGSIRSPNAFLAKQFVVLIFNVLGEAEDLSGRRVTKFEAAGSSQLFLVSQFMILHFSLLKLHV